MLIFDEVQCGVARTGRCTPMTLRRRAHILATQGIGGGFPLGACLATEHAARGMASAATVDLWRQSLAMAAGEAVLDAVQRGFLAEVAEKGERLRSPSSSSSATIPSCSSWSAAKA